MLMSVKTLLVGGVFAKCFSTTFKPIVMKQSIKLVPAILLASLFFISCSQRRNNAPLMKNVTGQAGEVVVVMQPEYWNGEAGKLTRDLLAQPLLTLPQDEPLFDLIGIPKEAFGDIFKTNRALLITEISPSVGESKVSFQSDQHAFLQSTVTISAKNSAEYQELLQKNSDKIISFLLSTERKRLMYNYSRYTEKAISNRTKDKFGIDINIPPGFRVDKESNNFMWIRYETPEISQGIFIYSFPYESDSTFTEDYLVAMRNKTTRDNVPGPLPGSYMIAENRVPKLFNITQKDGNYAAETRGLWRVENDFMGGPFVNLAILDLLQNRVVVLDGYVYAPGKDKRNFLRQVEAMIYSARFTNQADIDKVNKQMEL